MTGIMQEHKMSAKIQIAVAGYAKLRAVVEDAKSKLDADPRFDMPKFCPNPEYIRDMKRYGILPKDVDPARQRIDPYATDRRYWALDWTDLK